MPQVALTEDIIRRLAPNARSSYREAMREADLVLSDIGANASKLRLAHFLAQVLHECDGLTILEENLNYSAKRLTQVWPNRFPTEAAARPFANNPEKLANKVYGDRMGNTQQGDGWKFRGRGMLQCTGRDLYRPVGQRIGVDLEAAPDEILLPRWSLRAAAATWAIKGCNPLADADSIQRVTKAINGGLIGLADRTEWLRRAKAALGA